MKKLQIHNLIKKNYLLRIILRKIRFIFKRSVYIFYYLTNRVDQKLIVLESFMGRGYSCNPKAIYLELLKNREYQDYKYVWVFKNPENYQELLENKNTIVVSKRKYTYYKYYARAKYFISNSRIDEAILKKSKQVYIQTWHGTPLKKLGYDISVVGGNAMNSVKEIRSKYKDDSKRYTYLISSSKFCTEKFQSAFHLKNKDIVKEIGYPRNDYLYNYQKKDIQKIKKKLKLPANKKIILYAPTWRDNEHQSGLGYTYKLGIDFNKLKEKLGEDYVILFRAHYFVANKIDLSSYKDFVYDVSDYDDIADLYIISDLLITDYSSVFFDYANLKRPIIFYMYDYYEYKNKLRDFYLDLEGLPGKIVKCEEDLVEIIKNIKFYKKEYQDKYRKFNKKYNYLEDGKSSKKLISKYIKKLKVVPLMINIFKHIKLKDSDICVSGLCFSKILNQKNQDINRCEIKVGLKYYPIKFILSKGIKFIKNYRINYYQFSIPVSHLLASDIQNKIIVSYDRKYEGRIIYWAFDLLKGKNRNSKVIKLQNKSIYLRQTIKNTMYFTVRDTNYYDYLLGKIKLFIAYILSKIYLKKDIILLFEKESERYEESASVLYERLIDLNYRNAYYIINKDNSRINQIKKKYRGNLIYKNTLKHLVYFFKSRKFIGTESIGHSIQLRVASRLVINKEKKKNLMYVFLQHGVMYMISLNSDLRTGFRKQDYKLHKIVVSSLKEADHFIKLGDFSLNDLYICGLPKFDVAKRNMKADKIVIIPTWRRWEVNQAGMDYEKTKYFKMIKRIFSCIPKWLQSKVVILPHPLMINSIKNNSKYQKYLPKKELLYDDILKECRVLITDYSSISYDAFYRGCNVIFYWEEKDECLEKYGNNTKLMLNEENAFGDICYNKEDLKKVIQANYDDVQGKNYIHKYRKIVAFHDNKNTDRLIEMLKKDKVI